MKELKPWLVTLLIANGVLIALALMLTGALVSHHLALGFYLGDLLAVKSEVRTIRKRQDWIYPEEHEDVLLAIQECIDASQDRPIDDALGPGQ